jgi:protein-disulfide isomerase
MGKLPMRLVIAVLATLAALAAGGQGFDAPNEWGRTPLLAALQTRDTNAARALIAGGADVNAANRNGITPLISATQTGNAEAVRALLEAGALPNRRDNMGLTALDWAERRKLEPIAALLKARGALPGAAVAEAAGKAPPELRTPFAPRDNPGRAVRGNARAPVTIYEYTDLQCPYCAHGAKALKEVLARYEGRVRVVAKHLPLPSIHPQAMLAARYFEAIALQDPAKAWAFHDRVFAEQASLAKGEPFVRALALELGADPDRLARALASGEPDARIVADLEEARVMRFDGVPVFVVDDRVLKGTQPPERFFEAIEAALARRGAG